MSHNVKMFMEIAEVVMLTAPLWGITWGLWKVADSFGRPFSVKQEGTFKHEIAGAPPVTPEEKV